MPTVVDFNSFQWGKETVHGTLVAATSKIAVDIPNGLTIEPIDTMFRPRLAKGLLIDNPGNEAASVRGVNFGLNGYLNYEQFQHILSQSVKGSVTATGGPTFVWTFARSLTANPNLDSWTYERRITDGSSPKDEEFGYALLRQWTVGGVLGELCRMTAEGFARRRQASTHTPALTMPAVEIPANSGAKIYIDSTWANLGVTQITGQLLDWSITFKSGVKPISTADGRADLDFGNHHYDSEETGLEVEIGLLVEGQYDTEKTAAEAGTLRAVRIQLDGTSPRQIQFDMLLKHELATIPDVEVRDGYHAVRMRLITATDGTNFFQCKVTNLVGTLN
jgi:hypothetical protein